MSKTGQYISCIRIGGQPILPPLVTPKRREECLGHKARAVELERKRERDRLFKQCLEDLEKLELQTKNLTESAPPELQVHTTLENQLVFNDEPDEPHKIVKVPLKMQNLTRETIDVTEYSDEGVRVISEEKITPPKLIRSNSYTLESPSPILLAHLQEEARKCAESTEEIESEAEPPQMRLIETEVSNEQPEALLEALRGLPEGHVHNIVKIMEQQQEELDRSRKLIEVFEDKPLSVSISSQSLYYSITETPPTPTRSEQDLHIVNLKNFKNREQLRKEWAASVIGAGVRGYLVRRLIKTEKVQGLIETIKDALLCAIQLHGAEVIEEADVELHRRLIQQVSAACYSFHDIFFTLSVKEQMSIIAGDRRRRSEKAKRPLSASSSNISFRSANKVRVS